jgi:hypothetical protein
MRSDVVELLATVYFADSACPATWLRAGRPLATDEMSRVFSASRSEWRAAERAAHEALAVDAELIQVERRSVADLIDH